MIVGVLYVVCACAHMCMHVCREWGGGGVPVRMCEADERELKSQITQISLYIIVTFYAWRN